MKTFNRKCSQCDEMIEYKNEESFNRAIRKNTKCVSCRNTGKNNPMHGKKRPDHSQRMLGENNPMYGVPFSNTRRHKISTSMKGKYVGKNNPMYGKKRPDWSKWMTDNNPSKRPEVRKKIRIAMLNRIEQRYGQAVPNYNPVACRIIEKFNRFGYNFRHAENGGEVCIDGYYPDGLDKKRKLIVEMDESHHFDVNGNLRQRDIDRQNYLEKQGYTVIRMRI